MQTGSAWLERKMSAFGFLPGLKTLTCLNTRPRCCTFGAKHCECSDLALMLMKRGSWELAHPSSSAAGTAELQLLRRNESFVTLISS